MPNDPKEQTVDWSKVTQHGNTTNSPTMITSLNEGANLIGTETSSQNRLIGCETFEYHPKKDD